jgi:predicted HTH domain antitoxin
MRSAVVMLPVDVSDEDAQLLLAVRLFEEGRASLGMAAQLAGFSTRAFMEVLAMKGVPVVNYPASDVSEDLANA